ncbi:MAG: 50S ribosomal protein L24 [Candidatus Heimdallarchaeota archaeon]|nr:MAG: 50S ribosomal protein L24 [Candidatus Heimdallarchaeota archaeon]
MGPKPKTRNPSKQRRRIYQAHSFQQAKLMSVRLSKDLQEKYKVKHMPVRSGDVVYITAGDFVGTEGKVLKANHKIQRLEIDGIAREKADKSKILYPIHPSKVIIRRFGKVDQTRKKILERRAKMPVEIEEVDISPLEAPEEE